MATLSHIADLGLPDLEDTLRPVPRLAADWPLVSDILSHRMDMPEHLLRWLAARADKQNKTRHYD